MMMCSGLISPNSYFQLAQLAKRIKARWRSLMAISVVVSMANSDNKAESNHDGGVGLKW